MLGSNVGGWTIDATFGDGKSAVVFSAEKDGVKGAIKIFHPELIERYGRDVQLARIDREKSLIGQSHPHLVTILDGGACSVTGHLFVVMERLPYENLHASLSAIAPEKYGTLISQVASAARFLEDLGLAHRDKPENIAATDSERAILLDLGVLLPAGLSNLTDAFQGPFIGTLRYSSPEFLHFHTTSNLVPSCGPCNPSKGAADWKRWMLSQAKGSPTRKGTSDIAERIGRLEAFEREAGAAEPMSIERLRETVGAELWDQYWQRLDDIKQMMTEAQAASVQIERRLAEPMPVGTSRQ
ncbi:protein kinase [Mesorhizobium australicum]|uniref:protein kinase domain-containing protein n=1 Tax=Mesorhizobium australicum TaxID=536018 RepID=UPI003338DA1A